MIVAVLTFFLDDTIFPEDPVNVKNKLKIFARVLETCLKTEDGSFDFYISRFRSYSAKFMG